MEPTFGLMKSKVGFVLCNGGVRDERKKEQRIEQNFISFPF